MKIAWQGYANSNHSWGICAQNICHHLSQLGHEVDLQSTNGYDRFPDKLKYLIKPLQNNYDMQLSYTGMPNFIKYFNRGAKNRFAIWNYEFPLLPEGHAKYYQCVDKILPSSKFSYQIFKDNKIPESKLSYVPHGIDLEKFANKNNLVNFLKTKKQFKILANIAQPHLRKNLPGLLEAYGKAFSNKDDTCLVLKVVDKKPESKFEVSFSQIFKNFKLQFPKHGECLILKEFLQEDLLTHLYLLCDAVFTMSHAEAFWLPGLEGLAAKKIIIAPRYGGQLDYLTDDNSLLINGNMVRSPLDAQYWSASLYNQMFLPNIDDAVEKLRFAYHHQNDLNLKFIKNSTDILSFFSWKNVCDEIIKLAN